MDIFKNKIDDIRIETERLILRPLRLEDALLLHPLINDADVAKYMVAIPHPYPPNSLTIWIRQAREAMKREERIEFAILLKDTGNPIGVCAFNKISWINQNAELGYWLGKPYWGQGIMTEAARAAIAFGFEKLKLERIYANCFEQNIASAKVLEKAGLKYEGCARHEIKKGSEFINVLHYGMIRDDFISARNISPQETQP